jgi:hypothetical protein
MSNTRFVPASEDCSGYYLTSLMCSDGRLVYGQGFTAGGSEIEATLKLNEREKFLALPPVDKLKKLGEGDLLDSDKKDAIRLLIEVVAGLTARRDDAPAQGRSCEPTILYCDGSHKSPPPWVPVFANPTEAIKAQMEARQKEIERTAAEIKRLQLEQEVTKRAWMMEDRPIEQNHIDAEHTKVGESIRPVAQSPCGSTVKGHVCGLPDTYNPH